MAYLVQRETFEAISDEWERTLPTCWTNTIFLTPWWQQTWWRHFGGGWEPYALSVRDGGELLGIAPLRRRGGAFAFAGDTDLFDYHDFLVPRGKEDVFYPALWEHLAKLDWDTLDLTSLPQGSPTLRHIPTLAEQGGIAIEVKEEDMAPVASLPSTWDEYLAGLSKKDRHELRRKLGRLEKADNARQYACDNPSLLGRCMQDFFRLMRQSGPEKVAFLTPEREKFFVDVAHELAARGQFKLYFLEVNDVRVATCICFDYAGSYLLYNSGYDPAYSALSVGLLNKALCVREAIEKGKRSFDFLRGTERYKYDLGGVNQAIYRMSLRRRSRGPV